MLSAHIYSQHPLLSSGLSLCPSCLSSGQRVSNQGKGGKSYILFGGLWCFLGNLRDRTGQNTNIFLESGAGCGQVVCCLPALIARLLLVPGAGGRGCSCYFADVSKNGQNPLLLPAFPLCPRCVAYRYALISHFKGVFSGFWGWYMGLYCLRALRGLCGFCVRERLGGFVACGVFALRFVSLPSVFLSLPCFWGFAFVAPWLVLLFCLSCFGFVVSFSLSDVQTKRKGAKCFCVLSCPVVVCCLFHCCVRN